MTLKEMLCHNQETFDFAFGIMFTGLLILVMISLIVVVVLCIDNRRRKRIYKHKYRKGLTKETETAKGLKRILTFMAYKRQKGHLRSPENFKPLNSQALITDSAMDEYRNRAAANIAYFFAFEPRAKTVIQCPPTTSPIGSPISRTVRSPKSIVSPPHSLVECPKNSLAVGGTQQIAISSTTGTDSTASIQSRDSPTDQFSPLVSPKISSQLVSPKQSSPIVSPLMSPVVSPQQSFQAPNGIKNGKEEGIQTSIMSKREKPNVNVDKTPNVQSN